MKDITNAFLGLSHWLQRFRLDPERTKVIIEFEDDRQAFEAESAIRLEAEPHMISPMRGAPPSIAGLRYEFAAQKQLQRRMEIARRLRLRIYNIMEKELGAKSDLLAIVGSWGDTMEDEEVLKRLMDWRREEKSDDRGG